MHMLIMNKFWVEKTKIVFIFSFMTERNLDYRTNNSLVTKSFCHVYPVYIEYHICFQKLFIICITCLEYLSRISSVKYLVIYVFQLSEFSSFISSWYFVIFVVEWLHHFFFLNPWLTEIIMWHIGPVALSGRFLGIWSLDFSEF